MTNETGSHSPNKYRLTFESDDLLDPRWLRGRGIRDAAKVSERADVPSLLRLENLSPSGRGVWLDGKYLWFAAEAGVLPPPVDTDVLVTIGRYPFCEVAQDVEALDAVQKAARQQSEALKLQELNNKRDEALVFNRSLTIGALWHPGIKRVRSGLLENSNGDGRNKRSVVHIVLDEGLHTGRLMRSTGDVLCTKKRGWLGSTEDWGPELYLDGHGNPFPPKITCLPCIRRAYYLVASAARQK